MYRCANIFHKVFEFKETYERDLDKSQTAVDDDNYRQRDKCNRRTCLERDKRKENAQRRAEKKRAVSDDLTEQIFDIIDAASGELVDVEAIMENLDIPDITRNKVAARTTKLVKAGRIEKEPIKVGGKKRMAYRVADAVEVADAEAVDVDEVEADE